MLKRPGRFSRRIGLASLLFVGIVAWQLEATGAQLNLTWQRTSTDELGFSVDRSTGTGSSFAEIARTGPGVTAYTDLSVVDDTTYCYRVRAFTATAFSDYSNADCASTARAFGLAVVKIGAGSGTVTSTPAGIVCGASCSQTYAGSTVVTLTATPSTGSTFIGWSGGGCSGTDSCIVNLTSATTVMPTFELDSSGLSLGLSLSRHAATAGDSVQVSVTAANSAGAASVDLYFVVLGPPALSSIVGCPAGDVIVFIADGFSKVLTPCANTSPPSSFEPLYRDVPVPGAMPATTIPTFFTATWPEGMPPGTYTFAIFAAPAGTYADGSLSASVITAIASDSLQALP